ncbi:hypothetical protein MMAD_55820 (plasmid) [Mycolicibacterium madagascariense]|uniref:Uncharacterized protein n=1 Tax=Mycolicibacterium madagascariense TaxID=212765 RepID=A0A7I7XPW3_9MYCO|nr:hypothetical protein MMAD_55820 [Mycolicibacterium madagascariense]
MLARRDEYASETGRVVVDSFDRHLLQFVLTWTPFGGPADEDTFPRFGLRASVVHDRFIAIANSVGSQLSTLDHDDADLVRRAQAHLHEARPVSAPAGHASDRTFG